MKQDGLNMCKDCRFGLSYGAKYVTTKRTNCTVSVVCLQYLECTPFSIHLNWASDRSQCLGATAFRLHTAFLSFSDPRP